MTRINLIPVQDLTNVHLLAEYKELPRVFTEIRNGKLRGKCPDSFKLGKGHVTFFASKCLWLIYRYNELIDELEARGYNLDYDKINSILRDCEDLPAWCMGRYEPQQRDIRLSQMRVASREMTGVMR